MSPTTSAKHVKFALQPSFHCLVTAYTSALLLLWAVTISTIPLVASSVCFILLWTYCRPSRLLHQSLLGETRFVPEQRLIEGHRLIAYQHADLSYAPLVLIFTETKSKKWLLWRDACQDHEYRQLLVLLKREQQGSRYAR